jgi:hypothetical protein
MMSTDTEIVNWIEKNPHLMMVNRTDDRWKFTFGLRDEKGRYEWKQRWFDSLREMVSAAIECDEKNKGRESAMSVTRPAHHSP